MAGKARPSLRAKTLYNVERSNLNETDKECIKAVFERFEEVKRGEWLKTDAYPHRVYCSLCYKTYVTNEEVIQGRGWGHPLYCTEAEYCPHCGARMDERR